MESCAQFGLANVSNCFTVIPLNLTGCCHARVMPNFARFVTESGVISCLFRQIFPDVGCKIPAMSFKRVDFPLPLGPVITVILFSGKDKDIFCKISSR